MQRPYPISETLRKASDILSADQKLMDSGLVEMLPQTAQLLADCGHEQEALSLHRLAAIIDAERVVYSHTTLTFLLEALQASFESKGDPQRVYPLLLENLDLLAPHLAYILRSWAMLAFSVVSSDESAMIADVLVDFGGIMWGFPDGSAEVNLEIAIACCEMALRIYTQADNPYQWAIAHNNLALAISLRTNGDAVENTCQAYALYYKAKQVFTRQSFPQVWAPIYYPLFCPHLKEIIVYLERAIASSDSRAA